MNDQWNASVVTPEDAGSGTKVLDNLDQVQPTLSAGSNITIAEGEISASGTLENVQADWTESDPEDPSYIKHKPTIPAAQVQSDWSQTNDQSVDYIKNKPTLATVATSGSYNDLSGKPTIPAAQVQSDWNQSNDQSVDYIKNKPTIPSVDQNYNASSTNAQSGTAVAGAIATVRQVPSTQSSDNGKILGVVDANGTMAWVDKPVSNVTTKDKKIDIGVNGSGYPVEISYSATLGSIPGSKDLAAKSFDASDRTHTAVALKSWNYAQDGGLSAGNVAKLVIPESGSFGVYGESLIICYFNSTNNVSGTYIFLGGEDTGDGWPTYMNDMVYVAGTYDLPVEPPSAGSQSCDSIGILLNLSDIDASASAIAAAKAHMEEVMAGWTIQWPANIIGYNVEIPVIPAVTSADNNKVLTATWNSSTSTGSFGWATAGGGGGGGGGGSASISDIIRDINAANVQAGQTMQDWVNGLVSDIQAGKLIRLIAIEYSGDYATDIAYLDHYNIADSADPNDHMSSTFYFESKRYTYSISNPDAVVWELSRSPNT